MNHHVTVVAHKAAFLSRRGRRLTSLLSTGCALALWETAGRMGWVSPLFLPPLSAVCAAGFEMALSGEIIRHLMSSLWRIGCGFSLGTLCGVAVGLLVGFSRGADDAVHPFIAATYPIPKIAILPLLILWLGIGEASKIAVIGVGVFFPVVINTRAGVHNVDPLLVKAALSLGSTRLRVARRVLLPASLPMILAGARLGIGIALLLVVTAEMIAADSGIGFLILSAANLMETGRLLFGIMFLSALGLVFSWGLDRLERWLIPWRE